MKIISELKYTQPSGTQIKLIEMQIPHGFMGYPYSAERLVGWNSNFQVQEGWYGWTHKTTKSIMMDWRHFEERLQLEAEFG